MVRMPTVSDTRPCFAELSLVQPYFDVAAQQLATLMRETLKQALAQRANARDQGDTQNQTRQEDAESGEAVTQLAAGEAQGDACQLDHSATAATASSGAAGSLLCARSSIASM
jgi:hypothetical protein